MTNQKKVILSGIQPTSALTLGNYLGALKNWALLQKEFQCYFCVVDLHSLTVSPNPDELRENSLFAIATYLAAGIDPQNTYLFLQSHVPQHAQLAWVLNCHCYMGEVNRMTQFKDKSQKAGRNIPVGLFTYPILMAADILLYDAHTVPVGEDQKQHLELTRDLAQRANARYGADTFVVPEPYITGPGAKIMDLQDPTKKMSKSSHLEHGTIFLTDTKEIITKKFKKAVTDSESRISFDKNKPGISNLLSIQAALLEEDLASVERRYTDKLYGHLKIDTAEIVAETINPLQMEIKRLLSDRGELLKILKNGAEKAREKAQETLKRVHQRLGLVDLP